MATNLGVSIMKVLFLLLSVLPLSALAGQKINEILMSLQISVYLLKINGVISVLKGGIKHNLRSKVSLMIKPMGIV